MAAYRTYFAYLGPSEAFNGSTHARDDEEIVSWSVKGDEGDFPVASIGITWRESSYLAFGRRAALSVRAVAEDGSLTGPVVPVLIGTITALPRGQVGEVVELEILGRSATWESDLAALLAPVAASPLYFDALFHQPGAEKDASAVLEGWGGTTTWDRVTGLPRLSAWTSGPRTIALANIARTGLREETESAPLRAIVIEATASWQQDASVRSTVRWAHGPKLEIVGQNAALDAWPKAGVEIGGEWVVEESVLSFAKPYFKDLGEIAGGYDSAIYSGDVPVYRATAARVVLRNDRRQARTETVRIELGADVQDLMTPGTETVSYALRRIIGSGDDVEPWQPLASYDAGDVVFYFGTLYESKIAHTATYSFVPSLWTALDQDAGRIGSTFFQTARGAQALAHMLRLAEQRLLLASRAARISFSVPLSDVIDVETDDMIELTGDLIRGGSAVGKVVSYRLGSDGWADVEIACCVGRGASSTVNLPAITGAAPALGPSVYPSTGSVTPLATAQIAALREVPDAQDVQVRVQIDAPAVPATYELARAITLDCGAASIPNQVQVEP